MSGGYFDHIQYRMMEAEQKLEFLIADNTEYNQTTIYEFSKALHHLTMARVYLQRIDWLVSDDDSEETFHQRLEKDICVIDER